MLTKTLTGKISPYQKASIPDEILTEGLDILPASLEASASVAARTAA